MSAVQYGPDCSKFQGSVNWGKVKASGCTLGGYKVSEGHTYQDDQHQANRRNVPAAGLVPLAYHYLFYSSDYLGRDDLWRAQADWYCSLVDPNAIHALDVEAAAPPPGLQVAAWIDQYRKHFPTKTLFIYSNHGLWTSTSHVVHGAPAGTPVWHAGISDGRYTSATGTIQAQWAATAATVNSMASLGYPSAPLIQITDHAVVPGVAGTCDGNVFKGTLAELQALATGEQNMDLTPQNLADIADAVWNRLITRAWDGKPSPAQALLTSTHYYATSGAIDGTVPATAPSGPGQKTAAQKTTDTLAAITAATDTLEASQTAQSAQLAALSAAVDPKTLADAIAAQLTANGAVDAAVIKQAVIEVLAATRLTQG